MDVSGVLLSAGESKRMGQPKALLKFGERSNIENLLDEYLSSQLDKVIVVTGFNGESLKKFIEKKTKDKKLKIVINEHYNLGMFSSVQKGIAEISRGGILIGIVDNPFTNSTVIDELIENFSGGKIVIPDYHGKGGHPVIIPFSLREEILNANPEKTSLKDVFSCHLDMIKRIKFEDQTITFDMDTVEDYNRLLSLWKK
ncbi:MAG: nucleotidyltransferase family protein [Caldiserica bacterium]|nr:nucleotidyltransferase family protein [Caldisericota bacterium]